MGTAERRDRERRQRRNAILDAAEEVFAEKGLKQATIDDVAERAEISKGTVYLYFKSKEMIFLGIDVRATRILREKFQAAADAQKTGIDKVIAIGRAYHDFCLEYPNYFNVMTMAESIKESAYLELAEEPLAREAHEVGMGVNQITHDALVTGQQDGSVDTEVNPWVVAISLWAQCNGLLLMLKNQAEHFKSHGLSLDSMWTDFETQIRRGLAPAKK